MARAWAHGNGTMRRGVEGRDGAMAPHISLVWREERKKKTIARNLESLLLSLKQAHSVNLQIRRNTVIVVNTEIVPGYEIVEMKGLVQGNTVRAKHVGRDIAASFKNIVGGELKGYTELLTESRREAITRMMQQAELLGANAVVNVRFSTSAITSGASEMMAYGTAVVVRPL